MDKSSQKLGESALATSRSSVSQCAAPKIHDLAGNGGLAAYAVRLGRYNLRNIFIGGLGVVERHRACTQIRVFLGKI